MSEAERKVIEIPEICRVEGHSAVTIDIEDGKVSEVKLDVFEGTRFFERIILGHKYDEVAHISSRVCAICSTGHVLAAIKAVEAAIGFNASTVTELYRELMHLGMIIESHATHICALALPDFLQTYSLTDFASRFPGEFGIWTKLRNLGASIQTVIGGRPFHPVNLHVGGLSHYSRADELAPLAEKLKENLPNAEALCQLLLTFALPIEQTAPATFLALIPESENYGYFGNTIKSSDGWTAPISDYKNYLQEQVVSHSHAKRSLAKGKPIMVGSIARLMFFADRLGSKARAIFESTPLARGNFNTLLNNIAQAIEVVEAIERAQKIIEELSAQANKEKMPELSAAIKAGSGVGAVECPRGTLYHFYELDNEGTVLAADMITPSAQNTARIEQDIGWVVEHYPEKSGEQLQSHLETLVRAYDPCNTCATHMVELRYVKR